MKPNQVPEPVALGGDDPFARFELRSGMRRVSVTIAAQALEALSGLVEPTTAAQRRQSFERFRIPINTVAQCKIDALASTPSGTRIDSIRMTMDDLAGILTAATVGRAVSYPSRDAAAQPRFAA